MFIFRRSRKISNQNQSLRNLGIKQTKAIVDSEYKETRVFHEINYKEKFSSHISQYIGQTVTLFVCGGGIMGSGFTGVLSDVNPYYIKLISQIGPLPSCALGNSCYLQYGLLKNNIYNYKTVKNQIVSGVGSITYIPINKIISFVHSAI